MVELVNFMCPISLDLMKDPVMLSTGQTYDRRSIERWFETGHNTCPITMQVIDSNNVAPNRTLRQLIRRWCICNNFGSAVDIPRQQSSRGDLEYTQQRDIPRQQSSPGDLEYIQQRNIPRQQSSSGDLEYSQQRGTGQQSSPGDLEYSQQRGTGRKVKQTVQQVALGEDRYTSLKKLRRLAMDSNRQHENRMAIRDAGAIPILTHFAFSPENLSQDLLETCELALGLLTLLLPSQNISHLVQIDKKQLTAISWFLNRGSLDARVNAAIVLERVCKDGHQLKLLVGATAGVFEGLVQLLKDRQNPRATDAALEAIITIISGVERNTVRTVEAGVVFAVAELLPEAATRGQDRPLTKLLEELSSCREGREAVSKHALIVPMLVRIIDGRDIMAAESAMSCLWTISQFSPANWLDEAAGQAGVLIQLWHFCQADESFRLNPETKQRAADLLRRARERINHYGTGRDRGTTCARVVRPPNNFRLPAPSAQRSTSF